MAGRHHRKEESTLLETITRHLYHKDIGSCSDRELYAALIALCKQKNASATRSPWPNGRKLYYISAEFLLGKLLSNQLINLGCYEQVSHELQAAGKSLSQLEELEPEPSLGNGGLGRLAACFLDSIATLGLNGDGIGLNYHLGLFRQVFEDHCQKELPNPWMEAQCWLSKTNLHFSVPFGKLTLEAEMYDIDIPGYQRPDGTARKLHLFDTPTVDPSIVTEGISFDKTDIPRNLTLFLYPDDSDHAGKLLRLYQQYFMVSCAAQLIFMELEQQGFAPETLAQHVVVQINDTHPSLIIPELMRLLHQKGISMQKAAEIVSGTCAYTNHTILAEALEKWPLADLEEVVPQLVPILQYLDSQVKEKYPDPRLAIIDQHQMVHMAHLDIHYGFSINGVAALHTEILKTSELQPFYQIYPQKFSNKTNGITFRRWLISANPALSSFLSTHIGENWKQDPKHLETLLHYRDDAETISRLLTIKQYNKHLLTEYLLQSQNIHLNENSIFDIQIKRLHEYKRQQMNALYLIYKYLEIKKGNYPSTPITAIFGAKAAPAYLLAKDIIHLLLCLQHLVQQDPVVSQHLKVVMVENYNVSSAEKLIPACDISEQISLASKEASGTGNMKLMLNGAVTLGTMDGANVEISQLVGKENIYLFGAKSPEVLSLYQNGGYHAATYYQNPEIRPLVDFIISEPLMQIGKPQFLQRLHQELSQKDWFMTLLDFKAYLETKERAFADYENRQQWGRKMLINIAKAGYFSSDRTIAEYNRDIWRV